MMEAMEYLYLAMFAQIQRASVSQEFIEAYRNAAGQGAPPGIQELDFAETGRYHMYCIMSGMKDGSLGTGDLRGKIPVYQHDALLFASGLHVGRDFGQYIKDN